MTINDVCKFIETYAPSNLQESYDNAGLILGNPKTKITNVLISIDVTEPVVLEAIERNCNLIVAHHPLIFKGLKKITDSTYTERTVALAIKNDIAVFSAHTNLDNIAGGVNSKIAQKIGLIHTQMLAPKPDVLHKFAVFVPNSAVETVREAMFEAGAGHIGNYDSCSFNLSGFGTFRAGTGANPHVGEIGNVHTEPEVRIESIVPNHLINKVIEKISAVHPYEEIAYDLIPMSNTSDKFGTGIVGELREDLSEQEFLTMLKLKFNVPIVRHTQFLGKPIKKIAVCGGSCSFMLKQAMRANADAFVSADFKYHEFFDAENQILIADIGHYESEQFTKEIFYEILSKKFHTFASYLSEINTNPIKYF